MKIHSQAQLPSRPQRVRRSPGILGLLPLLLYLCACGGAVPSQLRTASENDDIPGGMTVIFTDYHPTWGGERIEVRSDRSIRVRRWSPGQSEEAPTSWSGEVPEAAMHQLLDLLVEIQAWEQRVESGAPRIDDAKAQLEVRIGGERETIWEWANDLEANRRIVRVKQHLDALAFEARHPMTP